MTGLSGPLVLAVPSTVAFLATFAWDVWARPAQPPRFAGYAVRQGWQVDPAAVLDRQLRQAKLTGAILTVRGRLVRELTEHHRLTSREIAAAGRPFGRRRDPTIVRACRAVRQLDSTYRIADRAEDPRRTDLWSRWRRPAWRATARRRFETELPSVDSLLPLLESAS